MGKFWGVLGFVVIASVATVAAVSAQPSKDAAARAHLARFATLANEDSRLVQAKSRFDNISLEYSHLSDLTNLVGRPDDWKYCASALDREIDRLANELDALVELHQLNVGMEAMDDQQAVSGGVWVHAKSSRENVELLQFLLVKAAPQCPNDSLAQQKFEALRSWATDTSSLLMTVEQSADAMRK